MPTSTLIDTADNVIIPKTPAADAAVSAVSDYFVALGYDREDEAVRRAVGDIVSSALSAVSSSSPREDPSEDVRVAVTAALRMVTRDLDHWLRRMPAGQASSGAIFGRVAADIEGVRRPAAPRERRNVMPSQSLQNRPGVVLRWTIRKARRACRDSSLLRACRAAFM